MKKISALFFAGFITLFFSVNLQAQSNENSLDQVELLKQFIGTWEAEIAEDTSITWETIPLGKGFEATFTWKAKGEAYLTARGICGFAKRYQKVNMFILYPGGSIQRSLGEFVSETKMHMDTYNYDHSKVWTKFEIDFPTPDSWNAIVKKESSTGTWEVVFKYNYKRIK